MNPPALHPATRDADGLPFIRNLPLQPAWLATLREEALEPELAIVDPHHHFWDHEDGYLLDDLLADLGDDVDAVLQAHIDAGEGRFRGVRHITTWHADFNASMLGRPPADLMQRASFRCGLARLAHFGLSFDAWLYHSQIGQLTDLARAVPEVPIVLNHVGAPLGVGPYVGRCDAVFADWRAAMRDLATCPNVHVKLGGLAMAIMGFEFHKQALPPSSAQLAADLDSFQDSHPDGEGVVEFDALMRKLDRIDGSYRN